MARFTGPLPEPRKGFIIEARDEAKGGAGPQPSRAGAHYGPEGAVLSTLLRESRLAAGLTQAQLGRRAGLGQELVSRGERGQRKLDILDIRALCRAMDLDFVEFAARLHARLCELEARQAGDERLSPPRPERTRTPRKRTV